MYHTYNDDNEYDTNAEPLETVHLYVVPEEELPMHHPFNWPRLIQLLTRAFAPVTALLLLSWFVLVPGSPLYQTHTLVVPLLPLPPRTYQTSVDLLATGLHVVPATRATGMVTIYNGSLLSQVLPVGFLLTAAGGQEIETDQAVTIPPAHLPQVGIASVSAHALQAGSQGNIEPFALNQSDGASLVLKNISAFTGGKDAITQHYVTSQDVQQAVVQARAHLSTQHKPEGIEHKPCAEQRQQTHTQITITWTCQSFTYQVPSHLHLVSVQIRQTDVVLVTQELVNQS